MGEGEQKDKIQQSSGGEGLGDQNSWDDEGGKKDDESGGNRDHDELDNQTSKGKESEETDDESGGYGDDNELDNQSSLREKEDKKGSRHSTEEIVRISLMVNEDEEDEYKDLW